MTVIFNSWMKVLRSHWRPEVWSQISLIMLHQAFTAVIFSCCLFVGYFINLKACYFGFTSVILPGHWKIFHPFAFKKLCIAFTCLKMTVIPRWWMRFLKTLLNQSWNSLRGSHVDHLVLIHSSTVVLLNGKIIITVIVQILLAPAVCGTEMKWYW